MAEREIKLIILSPEKTLFSGMVSRVTLPGALEPFTVLRAHAPIISALQCGAIKWVADINAEIKISGGFAEVKNNVVTACVETQEEKQL